MRLLGVVNSFFLICFVFTSQTIGIQLNPQTCSPVKHRHFFDLFARKFPSPYRSFDSRLSSDYIDDTNSTIDGMCPSLLDFDHPSPTTAAPFFEKRNATTVDDEPKIATFEEWTRQKLEQELKRAQATNIGVPSPSESPVPTAAEANNNGGTILPSINKTPASAVTEEAGKNQATSGGSTVAQTPVVSTLVAAKRNYASRECGAKVIDANVEAENRGAVLNDKEKDDYMRNPCKEAASKYLVIELCETIQTKFIEVANFELFSSSLKSFRLLSSERYPTLEWDSLGSFTAEDSRKIQLFVVPSHGTYAKFLRLELDSHYGKEHYCTLSALRVYGVSMVDEYEAEANAAALGVLDIPSVVVDPPPTMPPIPVTPHVDASVSPSVPNVAKTKPQNPLPWHFGDCQKCKTHRFRRNAVTAWLCHVFSPPSTCSCQRGCIPATLTQFGRTRGQVQFLSLIMKPVLVSINVVPLVKTPVVPPSTPVNTPVVETLKKPIIVPVPSPVPQAPKVIDQRSKPPLPAGTTSHKESVFLKLNKRLTQLELNISLSSQYLTELSRQYVAQTESSTHNQAQLEKQLMEAVTKMSTRLAHQIADEIYDVRRDIDKLADQFHRFVSNARMHRSATSTAATFVNYFSGNACDTSDIAIRTDKRKRWDDEGIDLDVADGMWTTQQLVILVALMQTTTFLMMLMVMRYYNRFTTPQTNQIDLIKRQILKELLERESSEDYQVLETTTLASTPETLSNNVSPSVTTSASLSPKSITTALEQLSKKKRKRRNKLQVVNNGNKTLPPPSPVPPLPPDSSDRWDSTSFSSNISSASIGVQAAPSKKVSTTSRDSCFNSDGTENLPPLPALSCNKK